jgi:hypothetical protein
MICEDPYRRLPASFGADGVSSRRTIGVISGYDQGPSGLGGTPLPRLPQTRYIPSQVPARQATRQMDGTARAPTPNATVATYTHRRSSFPANVNNAGLRPTLSARLTSNSTLGPRIAIRTAARAATADRLLPQRQVHTAGQAHPRSHRRRRHHGVPELARDRQVQQHLDTQPAPGSDQLVLPVDAIARPCQDGQLPGHSRHPAKKQAQPGVNHLRVERARRLLAQPDRSTRRGRRDAIQALLIEEFTRAGARVEFVKNGARGDSPEDQLLAQFQGMFAEYEKAQPMERYLARQGPPRQIRVGEGAVRRPVRLPVPARAPSTRSPKTRQRWSPSCSAATPTRAPPSRIWPAGSPARACPPAPASTAGTGR